MSQSLAKNLLHLVFSTKHRRPLLATDLRPALFAYQAGTLKNLKSPAIVIGGIEDHIHILFLLSKAAALADVVEELKTSSSIWFKQQAGGTRDFAWQPGYAAFSVSESNVAAVAEYIRTQEEHHRRMTFQDELRAILTKHGVEFDERYLWD